MTKENAKKVQPLLNSIEKVEKDIKDWESAVNFKSSIITGPPNQSMDHNVSTDYLNFQLIKEGAIAAAKSKLEYYEIQLRSL